MSLRPCSQRYRWHLEKNATQMPAISWRLTTTPLTLKLAAAHQPGIRRCSGKAALAPRPPRSETERRIVSAKGSAPHRKRFQPAEAQEGESGEMALTVCGAVDADGLPSPHGSLNRVRPVHARRQPAIFCLRPHVMDVVREQPGLVAGAAGRRVHLCAESSLRLDFCVKAKEWQKRRLACRSGPSAG